ncbi:MAG: HAD family hydrolase [Nanoarchaeota archaeon]|nr:HAD family hydrolase [Nanoarchaeota archaeon]MBU1854522.1 HAD family hydrolase [Nanoarchaeota archaeon]
MVIIAKTKIKCLFFDFWGTIVENGLFPSPSRRAQRIFRIDMPFSDYIVRFEKAFMTSKVETLTEAFHNVAKEFDVKPPEFVYDTLVGMWNKNTFLSKPFAETIEVLEEMKKSYKLVLISNTDNLSIPQLLDKFDLKKYFDAVVLSCDIGLLKTDKKMFQYALKQVKLKNSEVIMVGDAIPTDVEGAKNAGIKAILVDRRDTREFEPKIPSLKELKSKLEEV